MTWRRNTKICSFMWILDLKRDVGVFLLVVGDGWDRFFWMLSPVDSPSLRKVVDSRRVLIRNLPAVAQLHSIQPQDYKIWITNTRCFIYIYMFTIFKYMYLTCLIAFECSCFYLGMCRLGSIRWKKSTCKMGSAHGTQSCRLHFCTSRS